MTAIGQSLDSGDSDNMTDTVILRPQHCPSCGARVLSKPKPGWVCPHCQAPYTPEAEAKQFCPRSASAVQSLAAPPITPKSGGLVPENTQLLNMPSRGADPRVSPLESGLAPRGSKLLGVLSQHKASTFSSQSRPSPSNDKWIGRILGNRYRIDELLGKGAMGTVYRASHVVLNKPIAIKLLDPVMAQDSVFLSRFLQEAQVAAAIKHPGIVDVYDFETDEEEKVVYFAMEYLNGQSLADRLRSVGRLSPANAISITIAVADAVFEAHSQGVIHRDLKPPNIFLAIDANTGRELVKVLDFGLSKAYFGARSLEMTAPGLVCGSPAYMSPEQALGNPVDCRSDVYSLGIILYELLSGKVPFSAKQSAVVMKMHINQPIPLLDQVVSQSLQAALYRSLEKRPEERFSSMKEFAQALQKPLDEIASISISKSSKPAISSPPAFFSPHSQTPMQPTKAPVHQPKPQEDEEYVEDENNNVMDSENSTECESISPQRLDPVTKWYVIGAAIIVVLASSIMAVIYYSGEREKDYSYSQGVTKFDVDPVEPSDYPKSGNENIASIDSHPADGPMTPSPYDMATAPIEPSPVKPKRPKKTDRTHQPIKQIELVDVVLYTNYSGLAVNVKESDPKIRLKRNVHVRSKLPLGKTWLNFYDEETGKNCRISVEISPESKLVFEKNGNAQDLRTEKKFICN
jgi:serine/threonine protein kinase